MSEVIEKALQDQDDLAHRIKSDQAKELSLGRRDVLRQGDLYILKLPGLPTGLKPRKSRQLADGDTQGSRHVLQGQAEVFDADPSDVIALVNKEYRGTELREYMIGPVFRTSGGCVIEHPEHGNRTLADPGCYGVVFQRSLDADGREERARD